MRLAVLALCACSSYSVDPGACSNDLTVAFSPMYSAYDGAHTFRLPAVALGVDASDVRWSALDPSLVDVGSDGMLTMKGSGQTTIFARAGSTCGSSTLTITAATPDDWNVGSARYNDGVSLRGNTRKDAACTSCHGSAANGLYRDVEHTPEQTGGFTDDELEGIFTTGNVPRGGYFDEAIVPLDRWSRFHQWELGPGEAKGLVVYLRSLTPVAQGAFDFNGLGGGRKQRDGGPDATDDATDDAIAPR